MEYDQLLNSRNEIRLVRLLPDLSETSTIQCTLRKVSLEDRLSYQALSYCWGDSSDTVDIEVNDHPIAIAINLFTALVALRGQTEYVDLWIDALCIDQQNVEERNLQVLRMTAIYRQAREVIAWIGPELDDEKNPLDELRNQFSQKINEPDQSTSDRFALAQIPLERSSAMSSIHLANVNELSHTSNSGISSLPEEWQWLSRFTALFSRPYWTRVWMVQELSVASRIKITCGRKSISWEELCRLVIIASPESHKDEHIDTRVEDNQCLAGYSGFTTFRDFQKNISDRTPIPLVGALKRTTLFHATDFHDKVYALLGISFDGAAFVTTPNYTVSMDDILPRMIKTFIRNTGNIDVITLQGRSRASDCRLPSWCPEILTRFDSTAHFEYNYIFGREKDRKFRACGGIPHLESSQDLLSTLFVQGHFLGSITGLSSEYGYGGNTDDNFYVDSQYLDQAFQTERIAQRVVLHQLGAALLKGATMNIQSDPYGSINPWYWRLLIQPLRYDYLRRLSLYNGRPKILSRVPDRIACMMGFRVFDTPTLRFWSLHNEAFRIQGRLLSEWASPWRDYTFWVFLLAPLISLSAATAFLLFLSGGVTFIFSVVPTFGLGVVYIFYHILGQRIYRFQNEKLFAIDESLGKSHMRIAVTGTGKIGLGHAQARLKDSVFILKGCTVPVILRQYQDGYTVVGMSYFVDVMMGQQVESVSSDEWEDMKLY